MEDHLRSSWSSESYSIDFPYLHFLFCIYYVFFFLLYELVCCSWNSRKIQLITCVLICFGKNYLCWESISEWTEFQVDHPNQFCKWTSILLCCCLQKLPRRLFPHQLQSNPWLDLFHSVYFISSKYQQYLFQYSKYQLIMKHNYEAQLWNTIMKYNYET